MAFGSRWRRAKPHVEELLDADADAVKAYWRCAAVDDPELRRDVEAYLDCRDEDVALIDDGAPGVVPGLLADFAESEPSDPWCGHRVGPWRLESVLGRGGMAVVYRVTRQGDGYLQEAALKWLQVGFDSPMLLARFRQEQQVLARLNHVGISTLIDGGVSDDGRPYVVMELVDGRPLIDHCRDLDLEKRLRLMVEVCEAVAYAHRRLVVHRDLKPSNVLVTRDGRIKLLDFGIAKVLDAVDAPPTMHSAPMTPAYASPEQRRGDAVTTVSDVYSLGLMLWQLATGRRSPEWPPGSPPPVVPSQLGVGPVLTAEPQLRKDLDAVILRSLEDPPERRYLSVEALTVDLENLLASRPVTARRVSGLERARRWALRNRIASAAICAAALSLLIGIALSLGFAVRAHEERLTAIQEANKSRAAMVFVEGLLATSQGSPQLGETLTVREMLSEAQERLDDDLRDHPALQREMLSLMARVYRSFSLHGDAVAMAEQELDLIRRLDPDVVEHALAQQRLGYELVLAGDYLRGAEQLEAAIAMLRAELGTTGAFGNLGRESAALDPRLLNAMRVQSYAVGSRPFRETMELRRLVLEGERHNASGADDPRVAQALNDYARTLYFDGQLDQAAADLVEADAMRHRLGLPALDLAVSQSNLSLVRLAQGRWYDAEAAAREALRFALEEEGPGHPSTATPLLHLGRALRAQGRTDQALAAAIEAVEIRRQYLPNHTRLADALMLLGALRCDTGDVETANELLEQARALKVASFSAGNWRVGEVDGELGRCLARAGKPDAARRRLAAGLASVSADLGSHSPVATKIQGYLEDL